MEAYCLRPNPKHTIYVKGDDADGDCVEHGLSAETPSALNMHEDVYANRLCNHCSGVSLFRVRGGSRALEQAWRVITPKTRLKTQHLA